LSFYANFVVSRFKRIIVKRDIVKKDICLSWFLLVCSCWIINGCNLPNTKSEYLDESYALDSVLVDPDTSKPDTQSHSSPHFDPPNIRDTSALEKSLINNGLVDVQSLRPDIKVELPYASNANFLQENVYGDIDRCYLQPEVALMLAEAQDHLVQEHPQLVLMVWDGVRPRSVQHRMWEIVEGTEMEAYVASPHGGSMHNYGAAVDLTLFHKDTGELDMGTPFDFFGDLAQPRYELDFLKSGLLSEQQFQNRRILRSAMLKAGFSGILSEWWHFNAFNRDTIRNRYQIIE